MELRINLDLEAAVAAALTPEKLGPILDKHITGAITSAIQDATGYRSKFSEVLKEQIGNALPHGLNLDDVAKFQQVLNQSLASLVGGMNATAVNVALEKVAKEVLPDVPPVVKLSQLMEDARERFDKDENKEAFYAMWEPSSYGSGGHLYLHPEELTARSASIYGSGRSTSKYDAKYQLAVTGEGEVYALRLDGRQITATSRPDVIGAFDSILMSMYVGRTRLEIDLDADGVETLAAEQYD